MRHFFTSLWFIFEISQAIADPSVLETFKGLGSVVIDPKFNPIVGAMAEPYLHGERYFGHYAAKNMEKENPLLKCIVKDRTNPQNSEPIPDNCPQDVVTSLIQWLFPNATMDGNFAPNRRGAQFKDIVSTFGPATIGGILNAIAQAKGNYDENLGFTIGKIILNEYAKSISLLPELTISEKTIDKEHLTREYEEKFSSTPVSESFTTFESVQNYLKLSKNAKKQQALKPTQEQMKIVNEYNNAINPQVKKKKSPSLRPRLEIDPKYAQQGELFGKIVVTALQLAKSKITPELPISIDDKGKEEKSEISLIRHSKQEPYHPDIIEMALLHFAWTISKDKQDIVTLLNAMPAVVAPDQLEIYTNSKDVYTEQDYLQLKSTFTGPDSLKGSAGLELAGILGFGFQYFEIKFPKKIGYTMIPLFKERYDPKNPKQERYEVQGGVYTQGDVPDCGESSLRTVLMFLLFDPLKKTFNIDLLTKNAEELKQLKIHPLLIEFFKTYFSPASARSYGARADWMRTTSFLENDISYVKKAGTAKKFSEAPVCEINAGVENMMKVLGVFLGLKSSTQTEKFIDMTPLNTFLGLLSTNENKWEWQTSDRKKEISKEKDKNVHIVFYQNNKQIFTWVFMPGHFDTVVHVAAATNWLQKTGQELLESKDILPVYLPLFINESFGPENIKDLNLQPKNLSFLLYSRELQDINTRMSVLGAIGDDSSESFVDLGKRLIDSFQELALADENTMENLVRNSFKSKKLGVYSIEILNLKKDKKFRNDDTLFHLAVQSGNLDLIKYLAEEWKLNFRLKNKEGNRPLHLAVQSGNLEVINYLVEKKGFINAVNTNNETPLHLAVRSGKLEVIRCLIENKASITTKDEFGKTPLHLAVQNGDLEVIKYLVENNSIINRNENINAKDIYDKTPLYYAIQRDNLDATRYLIENKASVNIKDKFGKTPLHYAATNKIINLEKRIAIVKYLVEEGKAGINAKDKEGRTLFDYPNLDPTIAEYLLEQNKLLEQTKN